MRVILGLDTPDSGTALVGGRPYRTLRTPLREVGALLDAGAVHPGRRARDHLRWLAHSNGLPTRRIDEVLDVVGLTSVASRRAGRFSLGMRQRLGIAAALLGDPPVLMFDEPVNGLDPEGVHWMRGFLRGLAAEGRAVLVSSHLMSELEGTADHLIVVGRGRLIADTTVRQMLAAASDGRVFVRTTALAEATAVLVAGGGSVRAADQHGLAVSGLPADRVLGLLAEHRVPITEVAGHRPSLEQAYLALTSQAVQFGSATTPTEA
jgi:ABC-2 type transport system ATP-binding protein